MSQNKVGARVVKSNVSMESKQIYDDGFKEHYGQDILAPKYNLTELKLMAENSTILQQCVEAYVTNLVGFGFEPQYTFDFNAEGVEDQKKKKAETEWVRLEEFMAYQNFDEATETIYGFALTDREETGNGFLEVIRDTLGKPAGIEHMDVRYMRVCKKSDPVSVPHRIMENGNAKVFNRRKSFRRFVQMVGTEIVYFKEYGDPRTLNAKTGVFSESTPENDRATEVVHLKIGSDAYGQPRWLGQLIGIKGARKAEELNYMYFKNGRHMPAAILVENGVLSEQAFKNLQEYMNDAQGIEHAHKFLLLEVEGIVDEESDDVSALTSRNDESQSKLSDVRVQIKSMAEMIQQDALFLEYDKLHRDKLRSAFRLPPLYTGEASEYNRATADTARKVTEEQVFQPERNKLGGKLSSLFLPDLDLSLVKITLKGPDFRDPIEIAKVLLPFVTARSVAPNDLRDVVSRVLGKTLEEWPEEIYNRPLSRDQQVVDGQSVNTVSVTKSKQKEPGDQSDLTYVMKDIRDALRKLQDS